MTTVLTCYLLIGLIALYTTRPTTPDFTIEAAFIGAVFALQHQHSTQPTTTWSPTRRTCSLTAQALCVFLPLTLFGQRWGGGAGFLAGSCLLLFHGRTAWALSTLPTALVLLSSLHAHTTWQTTLGYTGCAFLTGLTVYAMTRLSTLVTETHTTRENTARMAVVKERLRIASDLHDLLGYSLSAVVLKGELTRRLIHDNPERALTEITSVLDISRQALTDIRTVAQRYRDLNLTTEATHAQTLLTAAGIHTTLHLTHQPLPPTHDTILATTLREAVTNILRHTNAHTCHITTTTKPNTHPTTIHLTITNDHNDDSDSSSSRGRDSSSGNSRDSGGSGRDDGSGRDNRRDNTRNNSRDSDSHNHGSHDDGSHDDDGNSGNGKDRASNNRQDNRGDNTRDGAHAGDKDDPGHDTGDGAGDRDTNTNGTPASTTTGTNTNTNDGDGTRTRTRKWGKGRSRDHDSTYTGGRDSGRGTNDTGGKSNDDAHTGTQASDGDSTRDGSHTGDGNGTRNRDDTHTGHGTGDRGTSRDGTPAGTATGTHTRDRSSSHTGDGNGTGDSTRHRNRDGLHTGNSSGSGDGNGTPAGTLTGPHTSGNTRTSSDNTTSGTGLRSIERRLATIGGTLTTTTTPHHFHLTATAPLPTEHHPHHTTTHTTAEPPRGRP